jgi:hypothetical protein
MPIYPPPAVEQAMKLVEVITRALSGQITWIQAAETGLDLPALATALEGALAARRGDPIEV